MITTATVTLELRQPATLGARPVGGDLRHTRTHVPGWTLRGAFAAAWIARHGRPQQARETRREEFERLFEGAVTYQPAFIGAGPLSMAVLVHKRQPPQACDKASWDLVAEGDPGRLCPDCRLPLEMSKGGLGSAPSIRRDAHVARDRTTGMALDGQLFAREVLGSSAPSAGHHRPGQRTSTVLHTTLIGERTDLDALAEFTRISLGGSRTVQGAVQVRLTFEEPTHLRVVERARNPQGGRPRGNSVVLRLISPGVFVDEIGRPSPAPNHAELEAVLGKEIETIRSWPPRPRWVVEGGWHAASGLPKPEERAVAAGTTFAVFAKGTLTDDSARGLLARGVGLRRFEGFGALGGPPPVLPSRQQVQGLSEKLVAGPLAGHLMDALQDVLAHRCRGETESPTNVLRRAVQSPNTPPSLRRGAEWALAAPPGALAAYVQEHRR